MSQPLADQRPVFHLPPPKGQVRCAAEHANPLLPETLAFWALWHCRHARPPDALRRLR